MKNKILILLPYYKREKIVLNALNSIKAITYDNWELCFIDDSGDNSFKDTLLNFGLDNSKIKYVSIMESDSYKKMNGGSSHGYYMNESIINSNADIAIMLSDDDALVSNYLENLNEYFNNNDVKWCYSSLFFYMPDKETYLNGRETINNKQTKINKGLNSYKDPINPYCKVDASQVAWLIECNKKHGAWFDYPKTRNLDASFYKKMYEKVGPCYPTFFYSQYKGVFHDQLGERNEDFIINEV